MNDEENVETWEYRLITHRRPSSWEEFVEQNIWVGGRNDKYTFFPGGIIGYGQTGGHAKANQDFREDPVFGEPENLELKMEDMGDKRWFAEHSNREVGETLDNFHFLEPSRPITLAAPNNFLSELGYPDWEIVRIYNPPKSPPRNIWDCLMGYRLDDNDGIRILIRIKRS